ncbi:MAG: radical SAM protein, partial [Angelakisella sp.]
QFHLSLQSGCDSVLARMRRRYTTAQYFALVEELRQYFPTAAITTDMMVGFPAETDEEAAESLAFAEKIGFAKIHAFAYSPRSGTPAAAMAEQVTSQNKKQRIDALLRTGEALRQKFLSGLVGTTQRVLFEGGARQGVQCGHAENYTPVSVCETEVLRGKIIPVLITQVTKDGCFGIVEKGLAD